MRKRRCLFLSVVPLVATCLPYDGAEAGGQKIAFMRSSSRPKSFVRGGSNDENDTDSPMNVTTTTKASPNIWSSNSLHRFNEETLMVSSTKIVEDESIQKAKKTPTRERRRTERMGSKDEDDNTQLAEAPHVAVANADEENQSRSNNNRTGLFRWFGSPPNAADQDSEKLDTPSVQEPIATNIANSDVSSEESIIGPNLVTRLWWVNVWTQQLPDIPEEQLRQINRKPLETGTLETRNAILESITKEPSAVEPNFIMNTTYQVSDTVAEEEPPLSFVSTGVVSTKCSHIALLLERIEVGFLIIIGLA
jgi:hypothetical protein